MYLLSNLFRKMGRSVKKAWVYPKHLRLKFLLCVVKARKQWIYDLERVNVYARIRSKGDTRTFFSKVTNKLEWGAGGKVRYFFIFQNSPTLYFKVWKIYFFLSKKRSVTSIWYAFLYFELITPDLNLVVLNFWSGEINVTWLLWFDRCDEKPFKKW